MKRRGRKGKPTAWNSTLAPGKGFKKKGKRLRSRTLAERFEGDPTRYGPLFDVVKWRPCFCAGFAFHECGLGYAPATAHHLGDTDLDGMVPVCGRLHDILEARHTARDWDALLADHGLPTVEEYGRRYVHQAAVELDGVGELPDELRPALDLVA